jgi:hypothetical protein
MPQDKKQSKKLDEAVDMTFPASDPINVGAPTGTEQSGKRIDRAPPVITKEQIDAAERGEGQAERDGPASSADERIRHEKHHGLADEGLQAGEKARETKVADHAGLGRKGKKSF